MRISKKMKKARKMRIETTDKSSVCPAFSGRIKERFREAWLQPIKSSIGTRMSRKIRKALRGGRGWSFVAIGSYPGFASRSRPKAVLRFEFLNPVQMAATLPGRQKVLKRAVFALRRLAP